jgi:alpha-N-arabinofuranosidase
MFTRRKFIGALPAIYALASLESDVLANTPGPKEYHVSKHGNDGNSGSSSVPLRTISAAARRAQPGDTITVHEGVYRERVSPPRGGESNARPIVYQAAPGERVEISGAEVVRHWVKVHGDLWKTTLPNNFFGSFNPYSDLIHGDWFDPKGRPHHTGAVYLDGAWLTEAPQLEDVLQTTDGPALWFGDVDERNTGIWAQFKGVDPNRRLVEINVRQTVFYPDHPGVNYITVRGFVLRQAATPWAPPTAEQIGLIGTHWSKGWVIENNTISHSICSGISLGKYGDAWDNKSANSAEGYVETIHRATKDGWSKENIGGHLVRGNAISHCEQAGIVGSLGAAFSVVTGNTIHDIHVRRLFTGAEMAGIKFHGAIDVEISRNRIYRTCLGLWLDWMAQGTRVTANIFHDNQDHDFMVEVDHGPFIFDNNVFLSPMSQLIVSRGGAFVHNLFCGGAEVVEYDARQTPFLKPHSTEVAGLHDNPSGDMRFYNNLSAQAGDLSPYDETRLPMSLGGNVFLKGAKPCKHEAAPLIKPEFDPGIKLIETPNGAYLEITVDNAWSGEQVRNTVTTDLLGKATIPNLPFEQADGTPISIDRDYLGGPRKMVNPFPGPFEKPLGGRQRINLWGANQD